jgi:transcriptional regulator with XRE-family HTH domain
MKEQWRRPSEVFSTRLRETRRARGMSQRALADAVTAAGRRMNKVAVSRLEKGPSERGVSLDEALALAYVLGGAPAHLLSPPEGELVALTDQAAVDGAGLRNFVMFGDPLLASPEGQRAADRMRLVFAIEGYAQAIIDAKRGGDEAGRIAAAEAIQQAIETHTGLRKKEGKS